MPGQFVRAESREGVVDGPGKQCFVISPIGEAGTLERDRADKVLKYIITPPVQAAGFVPVRADDESRPGIVTSQIVTRLLEDELVIADLTGANPNVLYELAVRHLARRPVVQILESGNRLPFDVEAARTVFFDHTDLESAEIAKAAIGEQIRAVLANPAAVDSPISTAIDAKAWRDTGRTVEQGLAQLVETVEALTTEVRRPTSVAAVAASGRLAAAYSSVHGERRASPAAASPA